MAVSEFDVWWMEARRNAPRDYERLRREALARLDISLAAIRKRDENAESPSH